MSKLTAARSGIAVAGRPSRFRGFRLGSRVEPPRLRVVPITVRSLVTVGGDRPGRKYLRKADANARRRGFASNAHMMRALAAVYRKRFQQGHA